MTIKLKNGLFRSYAELVCPLPDEVCCGVRDGPERGSHKDRRE